jgi:hypothetical protein
MNPIDPPPEPSPRRDAFIARMALCAAALAIIAMALPASALGAAAVSSNWAGYVARPATGKRLRSVSGTWVEPAVSCKAGQASYAAVWIGLGGYNQNASGLEQIGTDSDCTRTGRAVYSSWVELLPAAPTGLGVKVRPGDRITAAVTVIGRHATLGIRDLSTGERAARTVRPKSVDVSSAEWIVEAPSDCLAGGSCRTLPLADFGSVAFTNAEANLGTAPSTIAGGPWATTSLQLQGTNALIAESSSEGPAAGTALVLATPSRTARADGSFTVAYSERTREGATPEGATLPGFTGGPPG